MKLKFTAASQTFLLHTCIQKQALLLIEIHFWRGFIILLIVSILRCHELHTKKPCIAGLLRFQNELTFENCFARRALRRPGFYVQLQ